MRTNRMLNRGNLDDLAVCKLIIRPAEELLHETPGGTVH